MKTRIIIDSTADLLPQQQARVHIVPLTVRFGEEEYIDGVTIDHKTFYEKLAEVDVLPTTSQATPAAFAREFEKAKDAKEAAVVITLASNLSGTYQSAMIAAEDYENIYVVDGGSATIGGGILVELALQYLDAGMSAREIAEKLTQDKEKLVLVALVDTLDYLKMGGRVSKSVAFAGALLNIKPLISVVDGQIQILGKARGTKQGYQLLQQEMAKGGGIDFTKPVLFGYTGVSDQMACKFIEDCKPMWEGKLSQARYASVGSVVGTHAGPGAVAVAFFRV